MIRWDHIKEKSPLYCKDLKAFIKRQKLEENSDAINAYFKSKGFHNPLNWTDNRKKVEAQLQKKAHDKSFCFKRIPKNFPLTYKVLKKHYPGETEQEILFSLSVSKFLYDKGLDCHNYKESFEKLEGDLQLKKAERKTAKPKGTYKRKYYLHRQTKEAGFSLLLSQTTKTIVVSHKLIPAASENKYVKELQDKHNYGVQTSII